MAVDPLVVQVRMDHFTSCVNRKSLHPLSSFFTQVQGREDVDTTVMNRFVVLECAVRDPSRLRVKVNMTMRSQYQ